MVIWSAGSSQWLQMAAKEAQPHGTKEGVKEGTVFFETTKEVWWIKSSVVFDLGWWYWESSLFVDFLGDGGKWRRVVLHLVGSIH